MLLVKGLPGVGKSTLAAALARRLGWPLADKDDARDCIEAAALASASAAVAAGAQSSTAAALLHMVQGGGLDWNELSYSIMFAFAERQLGLGLSVVVDCPFSRRALFDSAAAVAARVRVECASVVCLVCV